MKSNFYNAQVMMIDDSPESIEIAANILKKVDYQLKVAINAKIAMDLIKKDKPTIILLDVNLPDIDGFTFCEKLKKNKDYMDIPIIFLTASNDEKSIQKAFNIGACDYVTKPFNPLELVARVKSNLRRYTQLGSLNVENNALYQVGGLCMNDDTKEVTVDGEPVKLTPIEYNILFLLVKNQGKVFSIDQIYENIWNEEAIGADNTVAVHIRHIREKIEINPKEPRYLKVVWGVGYKVEKQ